MREGARILGMRGEGVEGSRCQVDGVKEAPEGREFRPKVHDRCRRSKAGASTPVWLVRKKDRALLGMKYRVAPWLGDSLG